MKNIKLKRRKPIKLIMEYLKSEDFNASNVTIYRGWKQYYIEDENILKYLKEMVGFDEKQNVHAIVHTSREDIPSHQDNMNTSVIIIPIKYPKTAEFYCDHKSVRFKKKIRY